MPIIDSRSVLPVRPADQTTWKALHRIEDTGGDTGIVAQALQTYPFERLLYAEGDSWFDKFTPLPLSGTDLLSAIRLPAFAGVVDVSHIGDLSREMVSGWQRRQTRAMFDLFDFDAILLSAGGNDLKNVFASLFHEMADRRRRPATAPMAPELAALARGSVDNAPFERVMEDIRAFIALRDGADRERTRRAPLFLHGYDYLQPRDAPARLFAGSRLGSGPWIYPALHDAGLSGTEMCETARRVIDQLNEHLRRLIASLPADANVWLLNQRGLLTLAELGSTGASGDWMDEIHPTSAGFTKLAQQRWSPWLAQSLSLL
jgi:hypothetical protein